MLGLQAMPLQTAGRKIMVLPAWPGSWNVHYKLHAPLRTTVGWIFKDGELKRLKVTSPE